jgi:hypothetical protein
VKRIISGPKRKIVTGGRRNTLRRFRICNPDTYYFGYQIKEDEVRFQVPTSASVKITGFWDVPPYRLVEFDRRFKCAYGLHHQFFKKDEMSRTYNTHRG